MAFLGASTYAHPSGNKALEVHTVPVIEYDNRFWVSKVNGTFRCVGVVGVLDEFEDGHLGPLDQSLAQLTKYATLDAKGEGSTVNDRA